MINKDCFFAVCLLTFDGAKVRTFCDPPKLLVRFFQNCNNFAKIQTKNMQFDMSILQNNISGQPKIVPNTKTTQFFQRPGRDGPTRPAECQARPETRARTRPTDRTPPERPPPDRSQGHRHPPPHAESGPDGERPSAPKK